LPSELKAVTEDFGLLQFSFTSHFLCRPLARALSCKCLRGHFSQLAVTSIKLETWLTLLNSSNAHLELEHAC